MMIENLHGSSLSNDITIKSDNAIIFIKKLIYSVLYLLIDPFLILSLIHLVHS